MIQDDIEKHILLISNSLLYNKSEQEIIKIYIEEGYLLEEIFLLINAGKILYNDRKNAKLIKPTFKRV